MISYSKVFKASSVSLMEEVRVITQPPLPFSFQDDETNGSGNQSENESGENELAQQIIQEAREQAQAIIDQAQKNALSLEAVAAEKINQWWDENENKLAVLSSEAKQSGYQEGLSEGRQVGRLEIQQEYQGKLAQAEQLLEQAYDQKNAIIGESEPFLLELSCAIASQILKEELESYPDKFVELIKQHLHRFKEKEFITICVHPEDFDFILTQQASILAVVNGETEIKIIPDHTVSAKGCVIRTAYGSVDARIDTQIEEIKKVILEARREPDSGLIS